MRITHNRLNEVIEKLTGVTKKGQPWAKKNKERIIRGFIREMMREQKKPPTLIEIGFYLWMWIKWQIWKIIGLVWYRKDANGGQNWSIFTSKA